MFANTDSSDFGTVDMYSTDLEVRFKGRRYFFFPGVNAVLTNSVTTV